jgi:hypothetical protein
VYFSQTCKHFACPANEKIHEQAMKCEQVHYRGAKTMNCFSKNGCLHANGVELVVGTPC